MIKNIAAERGVLAGLVKFPNKIYDLDNLISSSDFSNEANKNIFSVIRELLIGEDNDNQLDKVSIIAGANKLGIDNFSEITSNYDFIDAIFATDIKEENIDTLAKRVKESSFKRGLAVKLRQAVSEVEKDTAESLSDLISTAESTIFDYIQNFNMEDGVKVLGETFETWANEMADNPRQFQGINTQYKRWDKAIGGGLRKGTVHVIGARAKAGKSALSLNIAEYLAMPQNIPVLYLDTELSYEYQQVRLGSLVSGVPSELLEDGSWRSNKVYVDAVNAVWPKIKSSPNLHHISVAGQKIEKIISHIRKFISKTVGYDTAGRVKPCLIIYDYLKIMDSSGLRNLQEYQLLGFHMSALHDIANKYQVPMLVLAQLNRDGIEREDESVIAGADKIIWFCSSFSILKKKSQEEIAADGPHEGNTKLKCILTRYGHAHEEDDYLNLKRSNDNWKFEEGKNNSERDEDIRNIVENQRINKQGEGAEQPTAIGQGD